MTFWLFASVLFFLIQKKKTDGWMDGCTSEHMQRILQNIIASLRVMNGSSTKQPSDMVWQHQPYQSLNHTTRHQKSKTLESTSHAKLKAKHWHGSIVKHAAMCVRAWVHVCPRDENYAKYSLETKIVYSIFVIARRILHTLIRTHKWNEHDFTSIPSICLLFY